MTYQTHFSTPLSLWVQLEGGGVLLSRSLSFPSPLFLNFFSAQFQSSTHSNLVDIHSNVCSRTVCLPVRLSRVFRDSVENGWVLRTPNRIRGLHPHLHLTPWLTPSASPPAPSCKTPEYRALGKCNTPS